MYEFHDQNKILGGAPSEKFPTAGGSIEGLFSCPFQIKKILKRFLPYPDLWLRCYAAAAANPDPVRIFTRPLKSLAADRGTVATYLESRALLWQHPTFT